MTQVSKLLKKIEWERKSREDKHLCSLLLVPYNDDWWERDYVIKAV